MFKRAFVIGLLLIAGSLMVSCQPATPVHVQSTQDNDIQDIHVQKVEPTRTTLKVEQFPLPNCGGTAKLEQSLGTYASASNSVTIGGKASITGGGEVEIPETTKLKLEVQVEAAYQQTFESARARVDSIVMSAAPGTHVAYTIVWEEQVYASVVQYSLGGIVYEVPYTYRINVPKIDKSYRISCPDAVSGDDTEGERPHPTSTIVTTLTVSKAECTPPDGLIPLWKNIEPPWSLGIWGSPNMVDFISGVGEIDTDVVGYQEFQIWLDPCYAGTIPGHGYPDGGRFWPKRPGVGTTSSVIPLGGTEATRVDIPANTGIWGLGPPY